MDPGTENRLRDLYHRDAEFRKFVDDVTGKGGKRSRRVPPGTVPIETAKGKRGFFDDPYAAAATRMFAASSADLETIPVKGTPLDPAVYKKVVFGHTHESGTWPLPKCTYHNTGSWCYKEESHGNNISRLCYLTVREKPGGGIEHQMDCWPNP